MGFRVFFVPNGTPLNEGQSATLYNSCHVHNRTGNWAFVPAASRYCAPQGQLSTRIAPTPNTMVFWSPPPGTTETVTRDTTQNAQVVFYSEEIPPGQPT